MIELELKLNDSINAINQKRETSEKEFESKLSKLKDLITTRPTDNDEEAKKIQTELNYLKQRLDEEIERRLKETKDQKDLITSFKKVIETIEPRFKT